MKFKDYYRILGIAPEATAEEIRSAYRKLARKFHPDVSKQAGAEKNFIEINEAHEALGDAAKRTAYDRLRAGGLREGQEVEAPPTHRGFHPRDGSDAQTAAQFGDFFQSMFGGASGGRRHGSFDHAAFQERGEDSHFTLAVSLEESYLGGEREIRLQSSRPDLADSTRNISVKIPKGVIQGTRIRLRGQGQEGTNPDMPGDLYLDVEIAPHRLYHVDGHDLSLELPIAPWEAVLGAQVEVPTLGGSVTATIPAGARKGQKLRLKGRGLPGDPPGDQYLTLVITMPPSCSEKAKELYQELAKASDFNPRAELGV